MIRLVFLALYVACIHAYNIRYDDELKASEREWTRQVPGISIPGGGNGNADCKKDIWILWDNSQSIGLKYFVENVKPFLKKLIPQLNVGPDGTHLGILTFSTQAQTRVLLDMGQETTPKDLDEYLDNLKYQQVRGDATRTGLALETVNNKMSQVSPRNHRTDAADAVILITDGQPWRKNRETTLAEKYNGLEEGEISLANDMATALKNRNIIVVGLAVETNEEKLSEFGGYIESWASPGKFFETKIRDLQDIRDALADASCIDPGHCRCDRITTETYAALGTKARVNWIEPSLKCASGRQPEKESSSVDPAGISPPSEFGVGQHEVVYTYNYMRGTKGVQQKCIVEINVKACMCPEPVVIKAKLLDGSEKASVSWKTPKPNCKASLVSVVPNSARAGEGNFGAGTFEILYNYEYIGPLENFSLSCPVKISVKGQLCGGRNYVPTTEICCCGVTHVKQDHHVCCGQKYINTAQDLCREGNTVI